MTDAHPDRTHAPSEQSMRQGRMLCAREHGENPGVKEYFDALSPAWEANLEPCGAKHDVTAFLAGIGPEARVLDVGCGTGIMTQAYLEAGAAEVVALDIAPGMIAIAQEKFAEEPRVRFECASIYDFDDERPFDAFVVYNAYPHLMDKRGLARKAAGLLGAGGRFIVAHGIGRTAINAHHACVPASICTHLEPAAESARIWGEFFAIDQVVDSDGYYCFGGIVKSGAKR